MTDPQEIQTPAAPAPSPETPAPAANAAAAAPSGDPSPSNALPAGAEDAPRRRRRRRRRRGRRGAGAEETAADAAPGETAAAADGEADTDADGETEDAEEAPEAATEPAAEPRRSRDRGERGERDEDRDERPSAASVRDDGQPADIDPARLDVEGLKILNRLHRFGHEAYFVGGCVRDLLVGRQPKDFDICTSAHPNEVRSLFRNCRLIGRRFRLAHIFFRGGKIIEVATFRSNPVETEAGEELPEDLLITRDNVFGTAQEDALRRDFTVNGLFYDIRRGRVIDYCDGLKDLAAKTMRTIGNPEVRMREDPVRILRAVRFAARLDFDIDPHTYAAMEGAAEDLPRCAPARLLEEVLRLLRGGHSQRAFELLHALGALRLLLPPMAEYLDESGPEGAADLLARLGALDVRVRQAPVDDSVIIAAMLHPLTRLRGEENGDEMSPGEAVDSVLEQMVQEARLPRRLADRTRMLLWAQAVLSGERRRRRSLSSFRKHPVFPDALVLLEIAADATGQGVEMVERWRSGKPVDLPPPVGEPAGTGRKRRRRRHRKRGQGSEDGTPPAPQGPVTE